MSCVLGTICATVMSLSLLLFLLHLDHVHQHLDQQQNSIPQKRLQPDQPYQDLPDQDLFHQDQQDQPWLHSQNYLEKAHLKQDQHQPYLNQPQQESTGPGNVPVYQDQDKPHPHRYPCMRTGGHVYDVFLKRHLPPGQPSSDDQNDWQRFIRAHQLCKRPTQSFLSPANQQQVEQVCTPDSGRSLRDNLCISTDTFWFFTVRLKRNSCEVRSVKKEHKHIILGCSRVNNTCRPVHFEGNHDEKPTPDQPPCQAPHNSGEDHHHCRGWGVTLLLLSLSLPMVLWR